MKTCRMCDAEKEDVSIVRVAPAGWNGFHDFVEVCAECQASRRFKVLTRPKVAKAAPVEEAPAPAASGPGGRAPSVIQITHRRTGALLHEVESRSLAGVSLAGAALSGADLQHAAMRGADLARADLRLADMTGADLREADLRGANFRGADLRGADLRQAKLYKTDLQHAVYDRRTQWPAGFDPRTAGARAEERSY